MRSFGALMTRIEVSLYTGYSERTITEMVTRGELPAVQLPGRRARYRKADVDRVFHLDA
jgi:excisionase family DNA binding protein